MINGVFRNFHSEERSQIVGTFSVNVGFVNERSTCQKMGHFLKLMDYVLAGPFKSFNNFIAFEKKKKERKKERKKSHNSHLF